MMYVRPAIKLGPHIHEWVAWDDPSEETLHKVFVFLESKDWPPIHFNERLASKSRKIMQALFDMRYVERVRQFEHILDGRVTVYRPTPAGHVWSALLNA